MKLRVVFMGSPDFAVPSLRRLAEVCQVVGVVTQPDRPAGRGRSLTPPPVKVLAQALELPILQPERMKDAGAFEQLQAWSPDLIVVTAFGQILRRRVLELPRLGCINVHASLLPRWRGAAPIQAAILHGDTHSGATIMQMDPGIDTGATLTQTAEAIRADDTTDTLSARLAQLGADLLIDSLPGIVDGSIQPVPQDNDLATYAPMIAKEDGRLNADEPAAALERRVRAFAPWPGTFIDFNGAPLRILRAHVAPCASAPGRIVLDGLPALVTCQDCLILDEVQPAGKKPMSGRDFLRGARGWVESMEVEA